ncbi:MAG: type II toxin-antitoxin system Phd/YefM family antitoxin [Patescibacteria group bacterium]
MDIYSITDARKKLGELVKQVKYGRKTIALGQHGKAEVFLVALPEAGEEIVNLAELAQESGSFDFLKEESDLYSLDDCREVYA